MFRRGDALPAFDLHCPLMSLPLAFGTTHRRRFPRWCRICVAPAERIARDGARAAADAANRVSASSGRASRATRTTTIAASRCRASNPLLALPGYVNSSACNVNTATPTCQRSIALPILRIDDALADFAETAAAIAELDLVIAVDTAVAHLAGGHGQAAMAPAVPYPGLALAVRAHRQPLVPERPAVPAAANWRMGRCNSPRGARACRILKGLRDSDQVTARVNFPPDWASMRGPWPLDPNRPLRARRRVSI